MNEPLDQNALEHGSMMPEQPVTINAREFKVMNHAMGVSINPAIYRNHFCTGEGSDDYAACESLVAKGLMEKHSSPITPDSIYTVTESGKVFVLP